MGLTKADRLASFQTEFWISYKLAESHLRDFESLVIKPRRKRMGGYLLIADSNGGKSALAARFADRYPATFDETLERMQMKVVLLEIPPNPSDSVILDRLLDLLGIPSKPKDLAQDKADSAVRALQALGVRVLLLDELQRVLGARVEKRILILDLIRYLSNAVPLPLVVLTTPRGAGVLATSDETINRLFRISLPRWKLDKSFQQVLASFELKLPLPKPSNLKNKAFAPVIYAKSEGLLGEVYDLLELALRTALDKDLECLTADLINSLAWTPPSERKRLVTAEIRK
jgi:hypothetical protein